MIAKQNQLEANGWHAGSSRHLYIILISIQLLFVPAGVLAEVAATERIEPELYTVTNRDLTQLSSDRFFGVKIDGVKHQQFCLFRPIRLASYSSKGPSTISIYAIGHDKSTDRVFGQFFLKNRLALWITLLVIAVIAGCASLRIMKRPGWEVKNRRLGFLLTVMGAFLLLAMGKGCLGGLVSIPVNTTGHLVDGGALCVDNATGNRIKIYLDDRFYAVVPGRHHLVIPAAETKDGRELVIRDGHRVSDVVGLPFVEDYVFVYNVSEANRFFVRRIDYERR